jgi:hypothetical protein
MAMADTAAKARIEIIFFIASSEVDIFMRKIALFLEETCNTK